MSSENIWDDAKKITSGNMDINGPGETQLFRAGYNTRLAGSEYSSWQISSQNTKSDVFPPRVRVVVSVQDPNTKNKLEEASVEFRFDGDKKEGELQYENKPLLDEVLDRQTYPLVNGIATSLSQALHAGRSAEQQHAPSAPARDESSALSRENARRAANSGAKEAGR